MPMVLGMMLRAATVPTSSGRVLLIGAIKVPLLPVAAADGTSAMCSRSTHMPHLPEREAGQRVFVEPLVANGGMHTSTDTRSVLDDPMYLKVVVPFSQARYAAVHS
jgi:hypothetical protein